MRNFLSFAVGLLFGVGLCLSGMTRPDKVLGFLDLAGAWDPSLAFVMGGALVVGFAAFGFAKKRQGDLFGSPIALPGRSALDRPLVVGSLIFGVGWGLAGVCPGPGVVDIGFFEPRALVFVAAMAIGMVIHKIADFRCSSPRVVEQDA
jgi:uncharacterized protein